MDAGHAKRLPVRSPVRELIASVIAASSIAAGISSTSAAALRGELPFVAASPGLLVKCRATAAAVGYPVPCPTRVPKGLVPFGSRPGCEVDIIGRGKKCPNTVLSWRGWVVGSSTTAAGEHLVLTASPHPLSNYARVVNGPAWYRGAAVRPLGRVSLNHWKMREVFAPMATNDGSAFANHVVLIWTVGTHTYGIGFHDMHGIKATLALDIALARGIKLVS